MEITQQITQTASWGIGIFFALIVLYLAIIPKEK